MECGSTTSPAQLTCLTNVILPNIVGAAVSLIGLVVIIMFIIAGYKYIMSQGDAKQLESARKTITYAIIGLVVVLFSFTLINIISYSTGVGCIAKGFGFNLCVR